VLCAACALVLCRMFARDKYFPHILFSRKCIARAAEPADGRLGARDRCRRPSGDQAETEASRTKNIFCARAECSAILQSRVRHTHRRETQRTERGLKNLCGECNYIQFASVAGPLAIIRDGRHLGAPHTQGTHKAHTLALLKFIKNNFARRSERRDKKITVDRALKYMQSECALEERDRDRLEKRAHSLK
jgi:hypothetical protein